VKISQHSWRDTWQYRHTWKHCKVNTPIWKKKSRPNSEVHFDDGHRVVLADRDTETGTVSGRDLADGSDRAIFVECDVSDPLSVHNLIAETLGAYDRIDGLINNAGIAIKGGALDMSIEDFDRNLAVNLRGAFLVSKAVAKHMVSEIENREDRSRLTERPYAIVNMSSINDTVAIPICWPVLFQMRAR